MKIKYILRRMRGLKTVVYFVKFLKEKRRIPRKTWITNTNRLQELKGNRGKRCFIIGNGPSLTAEDLELLRDEVTFASNRVFKLYAKTNWRPTFYCLQDEEILKSLMNQLPQLAKQARYCCISTRHYPLCSDETRGLDNLIWMPVRVKPPKRSLYKFSHDVTKEIIEGLTVTYSCMQMAAYMGFSEIILIGVDHNYSIEIDMDGNIVKKNEGVLDHFKEDNVSIHQTNYPQIVEMTRAYISAEKYSRTHNFRIFNATRGGKLEVFERRSLENVLGKRN